MKSDEVLERVKDAAGMFIEFETVQKDIHHRMFDLIHALGAQLRLSNARMKEMQTTIAFLSSVIKSGEQWSQQCDEAIRRVGMGEERSDGN